jgi:multidrug efflux system membrane fusion protein
MSADFSKKKHIESPWLAVGIITLTIVIWVGSGVIFPSESENADVDHAKGAMHNIKAEKFTASLHSCNLTYSAVTEPKSIILLKSEVPGRVQEVCAKAGAILKKGDPILKLEEKAQMNDLARAHAALEQKKINYRSAEAIYNKDLSSKHALADAFTQLKEAELKLVESELAIKHSYVRAPFDGKLDQLHVNMGDLVNPDNNIGTYAAISPMLVVAHISERDVAKINSDRTAIVDLKNKPQALAKIIFVSNVADKNTRTFRLEALLDNENYSVLSGETGIMKLAYGEELLQKIPAAAMHLDLKGDLAVKIVNSDGIVVSSPIEIVEQDHDGVWVKGLPAEANIITIGQSYVMEGQKV